MTNSEIADKFDQIADLLEFQNANPFRIRAYRNGARAIRELPEAISELLAAGDANLTGIPGIGKDLAAKCATLVTTGTLPMLDELLAEIPDSVRDLLRVPNLGPKKAAILYHELGIRNLDQLEAACRAQRVRELRGFGAKTEEAILKGIRFASAGRQRSYWSAADETVRQVRAHLATCGAIERLEAAGSYRRGKETVGDLDFLAISSDAELVMDRFAEFPAVAQVLLRGPSKMSVRLSSGLQADLRVVPAESFGAALQYFTGSKEHNVLLRGRAKQQGLKINEYGVFKGTDKKERYVAGRSEEGVYQTLGLPWIPPELREARHEFEWADAGNLPKLIELTDIRGDLHTHTTDTDGNATLEEMVAAAKERGLSYLAITDHSRRVSMARGLDPKRLKNQWARIDRLNKQQDDGFRVLKGVECDILERGGMDLPDSVLASADWVLASVHYGQQQSREQITDRIVDAIRNPHVDAIAHPTGRLINRREPYAVDMTAVIQAAAEYRKVLELNASPHRLDLNDVLCAAAKEQGVAIVISTDAHGVLGLDDMRYGVMQARRAGLSANDVLNTRPWTEIKP